MTLSAKVINLIWLYVLDYLYQVAAVGETAVVEYKPRVLLMGVLVEVIDPAGIETAGTAFDSVDLVSLSKKKFSQVAFVLSGNARNQIDAFMALAHLF